MDPDTAPVGPPASGTPCILAGRPRSPAGHRLGPAHGATVMPKDAPASPPNVLRGAAARACPCPPSLPRPHGSDLHGRRGGHRLSRSTAPQLGLARRSLLADPASGCVSQQVQPTAPFLVLSLPSLPSWVVCLPVPPPFCCPPTGFGVSLCSPHPSVCGIRSPAIPEIRVPTGWTRPPVTACGWRSCLL